MMYDPSAMPMQQPGGGGGMGFTPQQLACGNHAWATPSQQFAMLQQQQLMQQQWFAQQQLQLQQQGQQPQQQQPAG
eukprot:gene56075-33374_t